MTNTFNGRKTARYLWTGLVTSTIIGCTAFVYISLQFGSSYNSETSNHFSNNPEQLTDEVCRPICNSNECLLQSKYLLSYIEPKSDPCENYFEFACGKFLGKSIRNETRVFLQDHVLELQLILKRILDDIEPDYESATGKLKVVYETCLKESSSDMQAIPSLLKFLSTAGIPNWPNLARDFMFNQNKLKSVLGKLLTYQEFGFMDVERGRGSEEEADSKFKAVISIRESTYKKKEKSFRKYSIERILKYFNLESTTIDEIWKESEKINEAIVLLQEESEKKEQEGDISIICGTNAEARWEFACDVLESFIDTAGLNANISKKFVDIEEKSIYFVENIFYVLKNFNDRSIANYLSFNILFDHMENLNFYFQDILRKDPRYFSVYFPKDRHMMPWQRCIDWLMKTMYLPLAYEFIKEFTMEEIKEVASLVQENIHETADVVSTQDWIIESVRLLLAEVVRNIPNDLLHNALKIMNETALNAFYEEFQASNASFLDNEFEYNRFSKYEDSLRRYKLVEFLPKGLRHSVLMSGATGGGGYLSITIGTLLPPVYRPGLEKSLNLLSLASIIAHEIGHSLDSFRYGLKSIDPAAKDHVDDTFLCLANQFSKFKYGIIEKHINGSNYVRENFGDSVAISIIDNFIEKYSSSDDASLLPGLPYSMEQIFYLSALEIWCESSSEETELSNSEDGHSLGRFRMLGMIQNSKGFAKAFNCPEGSYMNPATKCSLFD